MAERQSGSVSDQAIRDIVAQLVGGGQAAPVTPMGYPAPAVPEVTPAMSFMLPQQQAAMGFPAAPSSQSGPPMGYPKPNLLDQARAQYPVLKGQDYGYTENFKPNAGYLEHWDPGDPGMAPNSPTSLDALRPAALPMNKHGLEIRDPNTRPIDILGDIASHHLRFTDPVVKGAYDKLQGSMTPDQQNILQDQYQYAQKNEGETGSYDDWKDRAGMPGFFRGYTFQQWPKEFNDKAYTPEQRSSLDGLMGYLKGGPAPQESQ